jgi:hypothetical protein
MFWDFVIEPLAIVYGFVDAFPVLGSLLLFLLVFLFWRLRHSIKILLYYAICIGSMIAFYRFINWGLHTAFGVPPLEYKPTHFDFGDYDPIISWGFLVLLFVAGGLVIWWAKKKDNEAQRGDISMNLSSEENAMSWKNALTGGRPIIGPNDWWIVHLLEFGIATVIFGFGWFLIFGENGNPWVMYTSYFFLCLVLPTFIHAFIAAAWDNQAQDIPQQTILHGEVIPPDGQTDGAISQRHRCR